MDKFREDCVFYLPLLDVEALSDHPKVTFGNVGNHTFQKRLTIPFQDWCDIGRPIKVKILVEEAQ